MGQAGNTRRQIAHCTTPPTKHNAMLACDTQERDCAPRLMCVIAMVVAVAVVVIVVVIVTVPLGVRRAQRVGLGQPRGSLVLQVLRRRGLQPGLVHFDVHRVQGLPAVPLPHVGLGEADPAGVMMQMFQ